MLMRYLVPNVWRSCLWEDQGFYVARNNGLKFTIGEIGVDTFQMKSLTIVKTMK